MVISMNVRQGNDKPVLGIYLGNSAGVGPELVAKLAAQGVLQEVCRPILIGDLRVWERGCKIAGCSVPVQAISDIGEVCKSAAIPLLDQKNQDVDTIPLGKVDARCGLADIQAIELLAQLCKEGKIHGFCFAPLNKAAMKEAGSPYESEHEQMAALFAVKGPYGEVNALWSLITTRATSHIPLREIGRELTQTAVLESIQLAQSTCLLAGIDKPVLGVTALNPHAGEGGRCGTEEIDVIAPAMEQARRMGIDVHGPFPADTLFVKAFDGGYDGVVTMYHDQGQIALKLKGLSEGVTVAGGMPYPIVTCAHGTAFDIAGQGVVGTTSFENAIRRCARMAAKEGR